MRGKYKVFQKETKNGINYTTCFTSILCSYYFANGRICAITEILEAMLINAAVWSVLFLAAFGKRTYDRGRLRKLKDSGISMDAEVEDGIPAALIRVGNYNTCRVSCKFSYAGKDYKAVSSYLILSPFKRKEDLFAKVYADKLDFSKCSVELFQV